MKSPGGLLRSLGLSCLALQSLPFTRAIELDPDSPDSLRKAASTAAHGMMTLYTGNLTGQVPGLLPNPPYYWWQSGAMFMSLIEYWSLTGDDTYNEVVKEALLFQVGPQENYMPPNQTTSEANDDQVFWAFAVLSAAELKFEDPAPDQPEWIELAQAVFNIQATRWEAAECGGGLRWQYNPLLNGYDYKNTITNGGFFQLGARLARYTGNDTYASWAEKTLEWILTTPIVVGDQATGYTVWDGGEVDDNCANPHEALFSYNYGTFIAGCAYLYDWAPQNQKQKWLDYLNGFLKGAYTTFFPQDYGGTIMSEIQCEQSDTCNADQASFKAYLSRWMTVAALLVPDVQDDILSKLRTSAVAAAKTCTGGDGAACSQRWWEPQYDGDGLYYVGEQMSAMSVIQNNLVKFVGPLAGKGNDNGFGIPVAPLTANTGGTSVGDPSAGTGTDYTLDPSLTSPITTGDKAGAGILTTLVLGATVYLAYFLTIAKDK